VRFENRDIMPHNLVITIPGAMAEVGMAADAMATQPDAQAKHFVPEMKEVMHATKMLHPGEKESLIFSAPSEPGEYPFVCTFPGHWLIMNGTMRVVEKLEPAMIAQVKNEATMGEHVHVRKFVKLWEPGDLLPEIEQVKADRSYDRGRDLFDTIGCAKCHIVGNKGGNLGPELTKINEKYQAPDLLLHILDPSQAIEEKYQPYLIETDREMISGIVVEQNERELKLAANPADPNDLTVISRDEVKVIRPSKVSTMPTGLLTTLEKEEIYDLLAFINSGGDPSYAAFSRN
jgi:putative heme-binding domain-containing protein